MKTIGLLGGMSWESTVTYYQLLNREVKEALGGLHSARCVLHSVDFHEIEECQAGGDWAGAAAILARAARGLELAGADFFLLCTNTMHKVADQVRAATAIPLLHIAEVTADELLERGVRRVGLLGTAYTMEQEFYKSRLTARGIEVGIPGPADRLEVNRVIYEELCLGAIREESRRRFRCIALGLGAAGAEGVILGCTEIGLLLRDGDVPLPLFDTTRIHARRAVRLALA